MYSRSLTRDFAALVLGMRAGHMGHWEYSDAEFRGDKVKGVCLWKHFLKHHPEYYLPRSEKAVIMAAGRAIAAKIQGPITLLSIGPGSADAFINKELSLARHFTLAAFAAVDLSRSYLRSTAIEARKAFPGAIIQVAASDIYKPIRFKSPGTVVGTMFGQTLFNVEGFVEDGPPARTIISRLRALRQNLKCGYLVITQDANTVREKIENAYKGQTEFAQNLIHRINRDTCFRVKPNGAFRVEWHPESHVLAHYLTFNDQERHFNSSYKIPERLFLTWARVAGFTPVKSWTKEGVALHLLRATSAGNLQLPAARSGEQGLHYP